MICYAIRYIKTKSKYYKRKRKKKKTENDIENCEMHILAYCRT